MKHISAVLLLILAPILGLWGCSAKPSNKPRQAVDQQNQPTGASKDQQPTVRGPELVTIVQTLDFSGGSNMLGYPGKITVTVKETNEILRLSELLDQPKPDSKGVFAVTFQETYYADGKAVHTARSVVSLNDSPTHHRVKEEIGAVRITYAYNFDLGLDDVAASGEVFSQETGRLLARYALDVRRESLRAPFFSLEERQFDNNGTETSSAVLRIGRASGRLIDKQVIRGSAKPRYWITWPTLGYGGEGVGKRTELKERTR